MKSGAKKSTGFFNNVTSSQKNALSCGMIKPQSINKKDVANMKIKLNPDQEIVSTIRKGLKRTGGYCPCRRERTEATKCMCQEFKNQIADPGFEGLCHCMLYYKSLQD